MQCQCCDVVQCHITTGRDEGQHNGTWDRQLALLVIHIPVSPPSWCLFNIYSLSIRLYHTDKAIHMYTYIFSLRMYACVNLKLSASAICFSNQSSFKQFPITYEHLHLYILLYPIMTTKIHLWRLNWPFSRTVHLLEEGGGQEEDTNCASKNYEREKDFAPFKRFLIKEVILSTWESEKKLITWKVLDKSGTSGFPLNSQRELKLSECTTQSCVATVLQTAPFLITNPEKRRKVFPSLRNTKEITENVKTDSMKSCHH